MFLKIFSFFIFRKVFLPTCFTILPLILPNRPPLLMKLPERIEASEGDESMSEVANHRRTMYDHQTNSDEVAESIGNDLHPNPMESFHNQTRMTPDIKETLPGNQMSEAEIREMISKMNELTFLQNSIPLWELGYDHPLYLISQIHTQQPWINVWQDWTDNDG